MRPPCVKSKASDVKLVKDRLDVDRRVTMHELCSELDMAYGTVHWILKDELNMSRVSARWVPHLLKNHEMERRVMDSKAFLRRFEKEGDAFLNRIITTDETWLFYYDPKTKQQSSQWKWSDSPPPKKAGMSRSMGKHMFIVFFDIKGVILSHAVPKGQSVNSMYYSKVLRHYLMRALARKRPDGYDRGFILHQDNAPAIASQEVQTTIKVQLEAEILTHPPYSPDLAPCDFALFPKLKGELKGKHFNDLDELR